MFESIPTEVNSPDSEKKIREFWEKNKIFERSVSERDPSKSFVFYEGPPTANGKPGVHHVITRVVKDLFCRYHTMKGSHVTRKAGWDTHGLPVEIEVEKELGLETKEQIEEYGVARFNDKCRESVFRYIDDWVEMTKRIGFWLDLDNAYVSCTNEYIETVWWLLHKFWEGELIYKGHKVVPYCYRCGTPLSSHEVSQGYQDVADPSVSVRMRLKDRPGTSLLVWTTTPWTLISNVAVAVNPDERYVTVEQGGERLILAKARLEASISDELGDYKTVDEFPGCEIEGLAYEPLYSFMPVTDRCHRVYPADFVSMEDGSGLVHIATAFGEDDYRLGQEHDIPMVNAVTEKGEFRPEVKPWAGKQVKAADPEIIEDLRQRGLLYGEGQITHSYPFCWRCDAPLIYYARESWYIRTTAIRDRLLESNSRVGWQPRDTGGGRFGNWLEGNVDWALSRDRFWGTPLNIWVCDQCDNQVCVEGLKRLRSLAPNTPEDLDLHKPYVDEVTFPCSSCQSTMRRTPEVIDCWFDSGSMPYAQWHYPFENKEVFESHFPADFIAEAIDQTRGWFYSLLAIATFVSGESSYRNCIAVELILDAEGQKMSKSRGNAPDPIEVVDEFGADPLRWYMVAAAPPWVPSRFDPKKILEVARRMVGTLKNVHSFLATYARVDGFTPEDPCPEVSERSLMDRWILSRLGSLEQKMVRELDSYELTRAARVLESFVVDDLSNWYVRRCRRRFWRHGVGEDKLAAYHTLYEVMLATAKLAAPFVPFLADEIHLTLKKDDHPDSVHLAEYPEEETKLIDTQLETDMDLTLRVVALGRAARNRKSIKVRQPLGKVLVHTDDSRGESALNTLAPLIEDELNVKTVEYVSDLSALVSLRSSLNYAVAGPKFGASVRQVASYLASCDQGILAMLAAGKSVEVPVDGGSAKLEPEDVEIRREEREGLAVETEVGVTVGLDLNLTSELEDEGMARELVNKIQNMRKTEGFEVDERIAVRYQASKRLGRAIEHHKKYICGETLSVSLEEADVGGEGREWVINGEPATIVIERAS